VIPKDFYFLAYIEDELKDDVSDIEKSLMLLSRLVVDDDASSLATIPLYLYGSLSKVVGKEVMNEKMMTPNQWLEVAFHLNKQRWDDSLDYIEQQPMSKIITMMQVMADYGEKMRKEMDRAKRK
jgi:hypothetical protein